VERSTWVKLPDKLPDEPAVAGLSDAAFRLHVTALCYCSRHLTDGLVPDAMIGRWGVRGAQRAANELVEAGLWAWKGDGDYTIPDYLDTQRSRAQVEAISTKRAEAGKRGGIAKANRKQRSSKLPSKGEAEDREQSSETDPGSTDDDYQSSPGGGSSSWTDDELFIEAGRYVARCSARPLKDFDGYATGAATRIRRERGYLAAKLRERGFDLARAASVIAQRDADEFLNGHRAFDGLDLPDDLPAFSDRLEEEGQVGV